MVFAVITGDIINSSKADPKIWLPILKEVLNKIGSSPKEWEIYRGDSFQVLIKNPKDALRIAIQIKASVKTIKSLDVRMSIGIGNVNHHSSNITESNGSAFIHSGEKFEVLKKEKVNLAIKSDWANFDRDINLFIRLALLTMDNWTEKAAEMIKIMFENPNKAQSELGSIIGIKQNAVSSRLKRAAYEEISEMTEVYQLKLEEKL